MAYEDGCNWAGYRASEVELAVVSNWTYDWVANDKTCQETIDLLEENNKEIEALRTMLENSRNCVIFTGAGISTESGIPDFRSPGGVWTKFQPIDFNDFLASEEMRREISRIEREQSDERILRMYRRLKDKNLIRWKESIKEVVGLPLATEMGLDR